VIAKLMLENVRHRPMPTLLSIFLIGVPVTLILILVGLSDGLLNDSKKRANGVGADVIIRPPNSNIMSFTGSTIPEQLVPKVAAFPHVLFATGTMNQSAGGLFETITGIDYAGFKKMSGGLDFVEGHEFRSPDDLIVDTYYADQKRWHAGTKVRLINRDWNLVGVVQPGKLSHVFVEIGVLQELYSARHMLSQIYLKVDDERNIKPLIAQLNRELPSYPVFSVKEFVALTSVSNVPALNTFISVIIGIAVLIAFAVVCLSMYMAVLQRTREIGILKAIGASKAFVLQTILAEAFLMGLGGTVVGILLSFGSRWILQRFVPSSLPQAIVMGWWAKAGLIALGAALLGALYPGLSAARQDPIKSLSYD